MKIYKTIVISKKEVDRFLNRGWRVIEEKEISCKMQKPLASNRDDLIVLLIRQKYSINNELAVLRQRDTKPDEYQAYFNYVEECKAQATEALKSYNLIEELL